MGTQAENEEVQIMHELLSTKKRFLLFLVTYIISVVIVMTILNFQLGFLDRDNSPGFKETLQTLYFDFIFTLIGLPYFLLQVLEWVLQHSFGIHVSFMSSSEGLFPGAENTFQVFFQCSSYLLFFGIGFAGILTKSQRTFRILYFTFIGLLIITIFASIANP